MDPLTVLHRKERQRRRWEVERRIAAQRRQEFEAKAAYHNIEEARKLSTPLGKLKALLAERTRGAELAASEARKWAPDPEQPGLSLAGTALDAHPKEHRARMQHETRSALQTYEGESARLLNPLIAEAAKEPDGRMRSGTALSADALAEAGLLVEQYRDRTPMERADLVAQGAQALQRGDLQGALAARRAAEVLRVPTGELDRALTDGDPERKQGRWALEHLQGLAEVFQMDVTRRRVAAGAASVEEQVGLKGAAHERGFKPGDGRPFVERLLGG